MWTSDEERVELFRDKRKAGKQGLGLASQESLQYEQALHPRGCDYLWLDWLVDRGQASGIYDSFRA